MEDIIVPVSFFAAVFGIVVMYIVTRNKERLAMIEKGVGSDLFKQDGSHRFWPLRLGVLFAGVGAGVLMGHVLSTYAHLDERVAFPSMIFLFAGMGLISSYYLINRITKREA